MVSRRSSLWSEFLFPDCCHDIVTWWQNYYMMTQWWYHDKIMTWWHHSAKMTELWYDDTMMIRWHNDDKFTRGNCQIFTSGVTDFKAVKDSSRSDGSRSGVFDPSLYFLIAGAAFASTLTIAAICVVVTFRRKVGSDYWLVSFPDLTFPKKVGWETWLATEYISMICFKPYISGSTGVWTYYDNDNQNAWLMVIWLLWQWRDHNVTMKILNLSEWVESANAWSFVQLEKITTLARRFALETLTVRLPGDLYKV